MRLLYHVTDHLKMACDYTRDETNTRSSDFINHSYDYRAKWTLLSRITIIYLKKVDMGHGKFSKGN